MKKLNLMTELCGIILGAGIYGLAVTGINIPSKLADGGVTGIALLLHNLLDSRLLYHFAAFNLPLLLISLFLLENTLFFGRSSEHLRWLSFYIYGKAFIYILL